VLALKERQLDEARGELAIRSEALDVTTEALRINQLRLEQSIAEAQELQSLLENLHNKLYCPEAETLLDHL
jgi:hypothetical protein